MGVGAWCPAMGCARQRRVLHSGGVAVGNVARRGLLLAVRQVGSTPAAGVLAVIIDQAANQFVETAQFVDGRPAIPFLRTEMFVSVDNHSELRPPITQMIVADHAVTKETQRVTQGVADDGRTDVTNVHRFGYVG